MKQIPESKRRELLKEIGKHPKELSLKLGLTLSEDYSIALLGLKLKI